MEIPPLISQTLVGLRPSLFGLPVVVRPLLFPRQFPIQLGNLVLAMLKKLWGFDIVAIGRCEKHCQPKIVPDFYLDVVGFRGVLFHKRCRYTNPPMRLV